MGMLIGTLVWGGFKVAVKYIAVPIAITMATAVVADSLADRMRARTARLQGDGVQSHLDVGIDPALSPAP